MFGQVRSLLLEKNSWFLWSLKVIAIPPAPEITRPGSELLQEHDYFRGVLEIDKVSVRSCH
jgi:hypothetical protein